MAARGARAAVRRHVTGRRTHERRRRRSRGTLPHDAFVQDLGTATATIGTILALVIALVTTRKAIAGSRVLSFLVNRIPAFGDGAAAARLRNS